MTYLHMFIDFANVLKSLMYVLTRLGDTFWDVQDPSIPHKVFDAVKDNDEYLRLLQEAADELWPQKWFGTYLGSFAKLPIWNEVFTKVMTLLCDEAQHERFCNVRPQLMAIAAEVNPPLEHLQTSPLTVITRSAALRYYGRKDGEARRAPRESHHICTFRSQRSPCRDRLFPFVRVRAVEGCEGSNPYFHQDGPGE